MTWRPATIDEVEEIVTEELLGCTPAQVSVFHRYSVLAHHAKIMRCGQPEEIVVFARNGEEVMYWDDIEEEFCISSMSSEGVVDEWAWCNDWFGPVLERWNKPVDSSN